MPHSAYKKYIKEVSKKEKAEEKQKETAKNPRKRVFVLDFEGDIMAGGVDSMRVEIDALLTIADKDNDRVCVRIYSPGGRVDSYGLGASQLQRLCDKGLHLTVAIDNIATSGGYLMACVANKIIAAPFSIVGSIGVVAEVPNVHRLLQKYDVDFDIYKSGEHKRTVSIFGKNTEEGKDKFVEELNQIHQRFKNLIAENRSKVDIDRVATGEAWLSSDALELNLVDELLTSDAYLFAACDEADVYELTWIEKTSPVDRLMEKIHKGLYKIFTMLGSKK